MYRHIDPKCIPIVWLLKRSMAPQDDVTLAKLYDSVGSCYDEMGRRPGPRGKGYID